MSHHITIIQFKLLTTLCVVLSFLLYYIIRQGHANEYRVEDDSLQARKADISSATFTTVLLAQISEIEL